MPKRANSIQPSPKKSGIVLIMGRPNVGKSTFVNTIIGQKVSITSPKSQTTRFPIEALYEDDRGQLLFIDTPGVFKKAHDELSKMINKKALGATRGDYDVVLYMIDHTRHRDFEEGRVLGIIRSLTKPVILVINKIDVKEPSYIAQYRFLENEIKEVHTISALKQKHLKPLIDSLFSKVTRPYPLIEAESVPNPRVNMHSKMFIEELIREKVYLFTRQEVPYKTGVRVEEIVERKNGVLYIKAFVLVGDRRYRKILIGRGGRMIQEIGMAARKELELSRDKKVFIDLAVLVDPHWQDALLLS